MAGGGIGEAMLIGAAVGGGTAIVTGQDPLKGALMGGLTGGAGGALMGGAAGAAGAGASAAPSVAGATTAGVAGGSAAAAAPAGIEALTAAAPGSSAFWQGANTAASALPNQVASTAIPAADAASSLIPVRDLSNSALNLGGGAAATPANKGIMGGLGDWYSGLSTPEKIGVGIGGGALASSLFAPGQELPELGKPTFGYDWRKFKTSDAYADGGIIALNAGGMGSGLDNPYISNQGPLDQPVIQQVPDQQDTSYANAPAAGYLGQSVKMMASGGISDLGGYSDGGRLLKGPGDGMSDHIPASIGGKQPARLADGEFVVPADVVSHLGNGSTDAGAKHLYKMMNKVRKARTGNAKQGKQINPAKYMAA